MIKARLEADIAAHRLPTDGLKAYLELRLRQHLRNKVVDADTLDFDNLRTMSEVTGHSSKAPGLNNNVSTMFTNLMTLMETDLSKK